ncbi:MAG: hypothetical protein LBT62_02745 [Deltaproteobacteria bacterium]|nr:hypothetical protein [Deltaproteobacteria bacterium]
MQILSFTVSDLYRRRFLRVGGRSNRFCGRRAERQWTPAAGARLWGLVPLEYLSSYGLKLWQGTSLLAAGGEMRAVSSELWAVGCGL